MTILNWTTRRLKQGEPILDEIIGAEVFSFLLRITMDPCFWHSDA